MNTIDDDDERFTRELLQAAGPRPAIPEDDLAAIKSAAHEVWQKRYRRKSVLPRYLAVAAALTVVIGLAFWLSRRPAAVEEAPVVVASVEHVVGSAALWRGQSLFAGSLIETKDGSAALRMGSQSLRLDRGTRVRLVSATLVELQDGGVYVDSTGARDLTVRTSAGLFTPVGTQFEVRVREGVTRFRVREGRVAFERAVAVAGDELVIDGGGIRRGSIRADDPQWQWVTDLARIPPIEGRSLDWFLRWCAREKGWTLHYESSAAASRAAATTLHGSVEDLAIDDALRTIALSSGVRYRIDGGTLYVTFAVPSPRRAGRGPG